MRFFSQYVTFFVYQINQLYEYFLSLCIAHLLFDKFSFFVELSLPESIRMF